MSDEKGPRATMAIDGGEPIAAFLEEAAVDHMTAAVDGLRRLVKGAQEAREVFRAQGCPAIESQAPRE